jgi:flavin-dependent dehydrogenase
MTAGPTGELSSFGFRTSDLEFPVVVVGAGPAGSVAARELSRRGLRVLLADKAHFPRPKVCGGCLNRSAVATLGRLGLGHVLKECGAVPLTAVRVAAGRRSAELRLPGGVAVSREALDAALVREAERAGATVRPWTLIRPPFTAPVTIVATGLAGAAAESHAAPGSRLGAGVLVPAEQVPAFYRPGTVYMSTARGGYVGLVRVEGDRLDVAAAFDADFVRACGGLGPAAEAVLETTGWPLPPGLAVLPWKGTPALTRTPAAVAGPGWFAVGDAAGYIEPFTGEGMAWAVSSAAAVAPLAVEAVRRPDARLAHKWERTHARLIRRRQWMCRAVARGLRSPTVTGLAVRLLSVLPTLARPAVALLNRPPALPHGSPA